MLYDYQYDIAALSAALFLLIIYMLRRNYRTKSNNILLLLMVCNIFGCIGDITSAFTISYPEVYPRWLNYGANMIYMFFYNAMAILFFLFVDSKAKVESMVKKSTYIGVTILIIEFLLVVTTPITGIIFYIDENNIYHRSPLMYLLYAIAGCMLIAGVLLFEKGKKRFNKYQIIAISSFIVVIIFTVSFQIFFPRYLIGQMGCALVMFFLYTAFENPVYYTYKDTRCFNRKTFMHTLKSGFRNHKSFSILAFAIHDYKYIKRSMSLKDIDRLSSKIAEYIYITFGDSAFCIGDDKFVILMDSRQLKMQGNKEGVVKKIEKYLGNPIPLIDEERKVSANYWFLTGIDSSVTVDDIIDSLDNLMEKEADSLEDVYNIKDLVAMVNRKQTIVHILNRAVENEEFDVYYQPIFDVATNHFTAVEALVRLNDVNLGYISPEEFIPIAEECGAIYAIGEIVFKKVCQFIKNDHVIDIGLHYVEINLSPLQCFQEDLVSVFTRIMNEYEINPSWINLEITETANFSENNSMHNNIKQLSDRGISFSLDDYGSGFASIDYLFKLPVDIVKIDKSILWQAVKDANAMIALKSTMQMLKDLGKHIVVEGVETQEMVDLLIENGCDYMQGYYYSKPIPANEYIQFLKSSFQK